MKAKWICWSVAVVGGLALTLSAFGATANLTEKFDAGSSGWTGNIIATGEGLSVRMEAQDKYAWPEVSAMKADASSSGGRFAGNYADAGISAVALDVQVNGNVAGVALSLVGASGRDWRYRLAVGAPGVWTTCVVPLSAGAGWGCVNGEATAANFAADLASVASLSVVLFRGTGDAQSVLVDNVKLIGPWGGDWIDGLPVAWLQEYFGVASAGQAGLDPDKDGLSNLGELLAGTNPNDASSCFKLQIEKNAVNRAVLRWQHVEGRKFTILRATNLNGSFAPVRTGISSVAAGNEAEVVEENGPYFYKVEIEQ